MFEQIKKKIEKELRDYIRNLNREYALSRISPVLFRHIKNFLLRKGKRIRPVLFISGYLGFAKKPAQGLYRSALSIELMHDFMLVHDDIIDRSDTRRDRPSMHAMLNKYLSKYRNLKFNGQDLTIVIGDVMYALALHSFLAINEDKARKEKALKRLIEATFYTGSGEFIELLYGAKSLDRISKEDIYKVYNLKTANYTFASPLVIGALLAGAPLKETNILCKYGTYLGRAFQIRDDILGMFSQEEKTGKSNLSDIREAKKTILIWHAYKHSNKKNKSLIRKIFSRKHAGKYELLKMRRVLIEARTLDFARKEINHCLQRAKNLMHSLKMKPRFKRLLQDYSSQLFKF